MAPKPHQEWFTSTEQVEPPTKKKNCVCPSSNPDYIPQPDNLNLLLCKEVTTVQVGEMDPKSSRSPRYLSSVEDCLISGV